MSKYEPEQLRDMAMEVLYAAGKNDPRYQMFLMMICQTFNAEPHVVYHEIQKLARWEE